MNQAIFNTIMKVKDMDIAVDAIYRTSKRLTKAVKRNRGWIFLSTAAFAYCIYHHEKEIKKLDARIKELETEMDYMMCPAEMDICEEKTQEQ